MTTNDQESARDDAAGARALFVLRAGTRLFAVFAEEVEAVAGDLTPTPLPFAPHAVRGVVSLRGRICTVVDPLRLDDVAEPAAPEADLPHPAAPDSDPSNFNAATSDPATGPSDDSPSPRPTLPRFFVALAGDEQLALACDGAEAQFDITPSRISPPADPHAPARGTIERGGALITLLDPARLFDAAMRGTERRRKRS